MLVTAWLLLGLLAGAVFLGVARTRPDQRRFLAVALVVVALVYVVFAAVGGAPSYWLAAEVVGVAFYGAFAWLGARRSLWWLALGWAAHAPWDIGLHVMGSGAAFTPASYAYACLGFDLLAAIYIAVRARADGLALNQ